MDHTAILQLIADRFDANQQYSDTVTRRINDNKLSRITDVLNLDVARGDIPTPPAVTSGYTTKGHTGDAVSMAFENVWAKVKAENSELAKKRFPKLFTHI